MIKDLTRREFLNAGSGAAIGSTILGNARFLHAASPPVATAGLNNSQFESLIFPKPQEISASNSDFIVDDQVRIVVLPSPSEEELFLARSLAHEFSDRFNLHVKTEKSENLAADARVILMGSIHNPTIRQFCARKQLAGYTQMPGAEGYILRADKDTVLAVGSDDRGAFYGFQSLRQLIVQQDNQVRICGAQIRDWPDKQFRGIYIFLPGRNNIPYFKRFVRDYTALYKYNTLIVEMGASMRLDNHPELNSAYLEFARDCNYSFRNYPPGPFHGVEQNSSHQDTADGGVLEKEEVADLARWVRKHHIEFIPELASFTHSYYLLPQHRELAAVPEDKWPDIYCPSNPRSYTLLFEVYDEFIELLKPKMIHIGHDELFLQVSASAQCKDEDIGELFGADVKTIHDYLAARGIKTALWGDMLLESVRGKGLKSHVAKDGWVYQTPGGLTPEQVERLIPKDCLIFNWFWKQGSEGQRGNAVLNEATLEKMGFQQVYGNFDFTIENYETRKKRSTILGGAPSAWFATNEIGFGKELMSSFLGCINLLWTGQALEYKELSARVQSMLPGIRPRLSGITPPSQTEKTILPVDISSRLNTGNNLPSLGIDLSALVAGSVRFNNIPFDLKQVDGNHSIVVGTDGKQGSSLPKAMDGILIGAAPTSLVFLHAAAKPAANKESYRVIWNQEDTADLLGWYEVVYEDGFVTTIPIRYGVHLLEWNWNQQDKPNGHDQRGYCYSADALQIGGGADKPVTFFAFEWINPRLGKVIQEIRLKGTARFRGAPNGYINDYGPVIDSNAVILMAISMVQQRSA